MPKPFVRVCVDRERKLTFLQIFSMSQAMNERLRAAIPDVETVISITDRDDIVIQDRLPEEIIAPFPLETQQSDPLARPG